MCAAFVRAEITKPSVKEAKAINEAYEQGDNIVKKMVGAVILQAFITSPCNCEDCKKRNEGIKYSQDGNKICATFADFVDLATSPAGFGDTEEEAKADLLINNLKEKSV